jgi:aquaporin Z
MDLRKCLAEVIGTYWLTFAGCGSVALRPWC